jgi:hypothetical protein
VKEGCRNDSFAYYSPPFRIPRKTALDENIAELPSHVCRIDR